MSSILVVDDSRLIQDMVAYALETAGFDDVDKASDGKIALNLAKEKQYNLVVTDINMPNMNGFELCEALRDLEQYEETPLVVLTTESSKQMKDKGRESGASAWLIKPFVPGDLLYVVQALLEE